MKWKQDDEMKWNDKQTKTLIYIFIVLFSSIIFFCIGSCGV